MTLLLPVLVGSATFALAVALQSRRRARWLARRVAVRAAAQQRQPEPESDGARLLRARLGRPLAATERRLGGLRAWRSADRLVERAALPIRTVELVYAAAAAALAVVALVWAATGSALGGLAPALLAVLALRLFLGLRAARRLRAFEAQLPELLTAIAAALRAGHSFLQAVQAVAGEAGEPAASELRRVLTEARLGRPLEQALLDLGARLDSEELQFVLDAVVIQRQVGGSLAGILEIVADSARQRQQFLLKVRALTATGRTSATVLLGLPVFVGVLLYALNPSYMRPLLATPTGHAMLALAAVLMLIGGTWLKRVVAFRG